MIKNKNSIPIATAFIGILLITIAFNACEDREYNNLYDENVEIDSLAPFDLQVKQTGIFERKFTWSCDADNAESFIIDKKTGEENWLEAFAEVNGEAHQWTDTAIELNKTYQYRVKTRFDKNTTPEASVEFYANIPAPSDLQTEKISDVSYKVIWDDNSVGEQGFRIDRKKNDENWKIKYGEVAANQTEFIDTNVFVNPEKNINVEYRVYAFYEEYESTKTATNADAELPAPTNLEITQNSITSVALSWEDNSEGEEGFIIERKYEGENWQEIADVQNDNYEDTNFELNIRVYYRIKSYYQEYSSYYVENDFDATIPAPSNLEITENSISSVALSWEDNSEGEEGFIIERKYEGGNWQEIADVQNNNYEDSDFELNTQVYYRIKSYYQEYSSTYAENNFDATIPAPENFEITQNSITSVTLNFNYPYSGHDGFQIDRKVDEGSWETEYQMVDAATTSWTDDVDLENHDYTYRVIAILDDYESVSVEKEFSIYYTDPRDGQTYQTVEIGNQVWFAENLNYETANSWWYNNDPDNGDTYGRLYTWEAALDACPDGWHLPSDEEWKTLEMELGMSQSEADAEGYRGTEQGEQMKSTSGWNNNGNGTNSSGFSALPGGRRFSGGSFYYLGSGGAWWSATEYSGSYAWRRRLHCDNDQVGRYDDDKARGFSVRCLKD